MIPDKFNMVDMGGIDLIYSQGVAVPGLYDKLMIAISQCRYQCLYNWKFDEIMIPPVFVEMEVNENVDVVINNGIKVGSDDVISIYSLEPVVPTIIPLNITENGEYIAPEGVDGYNPVTSNVDTGPNIISIDDWDELSTSEKRSLGLVVIQTSDSGYRLGDYVDASEYVPPISVSGFYARNSIANDDLSHTIVSSGNYAIVVAFVQTGSIEDVDIKLNGDSIKNSFININNTNLGVIYYYAGPFLSDDVITVTKNSGAANRGVNLIVLENVSNVICSGTTGNNAVGITLQPLSNENERYLNVWGYGYYSGANTIPVLNLFYTDEVVTTNSIDASTRYWYGGQYVLKLGGTL